MIEATNLTKRYGPYTAVSGISFKVEKGEIVGFLGPNGAGKTTTMRLLTGFMVPTEGQAIVAGIDVAKHPVEAKRRIGYLPENPPVYLEMPVRGYLRFVAQIKEIPPGDRESRIDDAMGRVGITSVADKLIGRLSKGYRQRVGLAQAIVHNPDVVILDEPTIGLDPNQIKEIRKLIHDLAGEHTVMLSTHILAEVEMTCSRVIIIDKGKVVAQGSPEELSSKVRGGGEVFVVVRGATGEAEEALSSVKGVESVRKEGTFGRGSQAFVVTAAGREDLRENLAKSVVKAGLGLVELRAARLGLEEVFSELTHVDKAVADASDPAGVHGAPAGEV